jgi:hypothetical protein
MKVQNINKIIKIKVAKGLLLIFVFAICLKPTIKLCYTFLDKKVDLVENVSEKDSEEEKVDDSEEFEKSLIQHQLLSHSTECVEHINYFKLQELALDFYPSVISPPPELS